MCQMQALVTALDIPWEAASHLLKHTRGNLFAAFKNELSAYHVNDKLVDELVWEYAAHRSANLKACNLVSALAICHTSHVKICAWASLQHFGRIQQQQENLCWLC